VKEGGREGGREGGKVPYLFIEWLFAPLKEGGREGGRKEGRGGTMIRMMMIEM